jgi:hypothetical protein
MTVYARRRSLGGGFHALQSPRREALPRVYYHRGRPMRQPTAAEINRHLRTGLRRVVAHYPGPLKLRVVAARQQGGGLEVQVMGWQNNVGGGWVRLEPDTRIDLL